MSGSGYATYYVGRDNDETAIYLVKTGISLAAAGENLRSLSCD